MINHVLLLSSVTVIFKRKSEFVGCSGNSFYGMLSNQKPLAVNYRKLQGGIDNWSEACHPCSAHFISS